MKSHNEVLTFLGERWVKEDQWMDDCMTLLIAAMYGNPPGGWSDPERRHDFQQAVSNVEDRLRNATDERYERS